MKKRHWLGVLAAVLFCLLVQGSQAGTWMWMNGTPGTNFHNRATQLYSSHNGWWYIQPAESVNVVNMNTRVWWKLEHSALRVGWSYWAPPWLYSTHNSTWYWMTPTANWIYHYDTRWWYQIRTGDY